MGTENTGRAQSNGKNDVLDSAVRLFNEQGYHGTSMRDIAKGAEITAASIYHHFASKQEILQSIMRRALQGALAMTRTAVLHSDGTPAGQLEALVRAWVHFHVSHQLDAVVGATELRSVEGPGRELVIALRDEQESLFRDVILRGVEQSAFATPYPHEATRTVISSGQSICMWWRPDGPLTPEELADRYVTVALATVEYTGR
ncbi:TetR family transcriptional regulator [Gordonia paraffinivorans]|uniref:TetR family transcriptional regulator n=1 Tax=Gordonia paraffinivorans TaxID=175628 RepID=UPI000D621C5E|nr:TetR family transcriptional regulator [Gordonia paraffinivorans]MBY4573021.1 TetR family transcriptional regulator [Gordonia paraffinivorans]PWD42041.1 TetR family transcriptional regulator [Gordonia paraffinivorans]